MSDQERMELPAEQFEDAAQQAHASRFGMFVFLASEVLFFGALFALYATYRIHYPEAFRIGVDHNTKLLGSLNTLVLLTSSAIVTGSVYALRCGRTKASGWLLALAIFLGLVFLAIKFTEYGIHFEEGVYPGGIGHFFEEYGIHGTFGLPEFWTLYYAMTGLHAIHMIIGIVLLGVMVFEVVKGTLAAANAHRLDVVALYWHFVDIVWTFLWPLFYLAGGS